MLAFPMKGTRWCSHRVKNSMSLTTTISSVSSVKMAFCKSQTELLFSSLTSSLTFTTSCTVSV